MRNWMLKAILMWSVFGCYGLPRGRIPQISLDWNGNNSFDLTLELQGKTLRAILGVDSIPPELNSPSSCEDGLCWRFGSLISLNVSSTREDQCYSIRWKTRFEYVKDCFQMDSAHWYGGGQTFEQHWALDNFTRPEKPFATGDFFLGKFGGVMEPYWLNSDGFAIHASKDTPLFVSFNEDQNGLVCLSSRYESPYKKSGDLLHLQYEICSSSDVKAAHQLVSAHFWNKPRDIPDERMFRHPIWSTWARYKGQINQNKTLAYASEIRQYGFNDSQLEIDDDWETCYGDLDFDQRDGKFPDPAAMVSQLKDSGFRVTLWIHPFINIGCPTFDSASKHLVPDDNGLPALTQWWRGLIAGYVDFSRPDAADWWSDRVRQLRSNYGIDSFKFDAGESSWLPSCYHLKDTPLEQQPNSYTELYVRNMERFGPMVEVRTAWNSQDVPIFTRMLDKESVWGYQNGLKTLVTTLLLFNIQGYPFVLPDMVGGNGYIILPPKELFVRWLQVNVFMPAIQFSYVPWDYDQEVVDIALKMTALHERYADKIISLARQSTVDGSPINRPLWWIDPLDSVAQVIDSEFLLGDDLLAAPVLEQGALVRDIYLPRGQWYDEVDVNHPTYTGPLWLRDYPAPLDTLPYFSLVVDRG